MIVRQADLDWESIFQEIKTHENSTGQFFSFAVLDTLDVLGERHVIVAPITDRLVLYCFENALLVSLYVPKPLEDLRDHQIYNERRKP